MGNEGHLRSPLVFGFPLFPHPISSNGEKTFLMSAIEGVYICLLEPRTKSLKLQDSKTISPPADIEPLVVILVHIPQRRIGGLSGVTDG